MIKIKPREQVEIDGLFKTVIKEYFEFLLLKKEEELRFRRDSAVIGSEIKALKYALTERGFEMFLTRMKALPYKKFTVIRSGNSVFLKGETGDLVVDMPDNHRRNEFVPGKYAIGAYGIYVPVEDLKKARLGNTHFIPFKMPTVPPSFSLHVRHLHHKASYYSERRGHKVNNPLTYEPHTCWGNFGEILLLNMNAGDVPELFRSLYLYLTIQNPDSPLVYFRDLTHYERIEA